MKIKIVNAIAQEGLNLLRDKYSFGDEIDDPAGIVVRSSKVDVADYPSLLAVARAGAGVNNITVDKATSRGICVFNTPGANANAVAELVMVMAGIGARNIVQGIDYCRGLAHVSGDELSALVEKRKSEFRGMELAGKTLGVLGLGQIGVRVANRALRQGMTTIGFDPQPALQNVHGLLPDVVLARSMKEMVRMVNILTIHVPLTASTTGMVNEQMLRQLPKGAMLLNYSRQEVVVEEDVEDALASGQLSLFISDFPSLKLLANPKVIITPHIGASTEESEEQCATMAVKELIAYLEYGAVVRSVNFPTIESIPGDNVHSRLLMVNSDRPGMIGFASQLLGAAGINIVSYLNESNGQVGYNIIDLSSAISGDVLLALNKHPDVIRTRVIDFS